MAKNKLKSAKVKKTDIAVQAETTDVEETVEKDPRIRDKKATMLGNQRLVNNITKENMIIYFLTATIPPVGLYLLWKKDNTIPDGARYVWTVIAIAVIYAWIMQLNGIQLATRY
ncbi:MAG: hypothetical protein Q4D46_04115 [Erysipelotrichaceae bacterium]|nr:hypothetical protein [Erysipelotrichaceae bacterium]